jgi:hypothetical protein
VLAERREAHALRKMLGRDVRVVSRSELQERRNRRTWILDLADGSRVVLKWYRRPGIAPDEAQRLAAANGLEGILTPRLLGGSRHHLVQECLAGEPLDRLARHSTPAGRVTITARAAGVLAAIHAAKLVALRTLLVAETCTPRALAEQLERARRLVAGPGLERWQALMGPVPAAWRAGLEAARFSGLGAALGASGESCVLGHGDFHLRHVLRTPDDRLGVVDWSGLSLVSPWLELAQLLRWHSPEGRAEVTQAYLVAAHSHGLLRGTVLADARSLAERALVATQLLLARRMVRKLRPGARASHLDSFRASLDALASRG